MDQLITVSKCTLLIKLTQHSDADQAKRIKPGL